MYEQWFRKYVTDGPGSVSSRYVPELRADGNIELTKVPTKRYEICKEVEYAHYCQVEVNVKDVSRTIVMFTVLKYECRAQEVIRVYLELNIAIPTGSHAT